MNPHLQSLLQPFNTIEDFKVLYPVVCVTRCFSTQWYVSLQGPLPSGMCHLMVSLPSGMRHFMVLYPVVCVSLHGSLSSGVRHFKVLYPVVCVSLHGSLPSGMFVTSWFSTQWYVCLFMFCTQWYVSLHGFLPSVMCHFMVLYPVVCVSLHCSLPSGMCVTSWFSTQ